MPEQEGSVHVTWKYIAMAAIGVVIALVSAWAAGVEKDRSGLAARVENLQLQKLDREEFNRFSSALQVQLMRMDNKLDAMSDAISKHSSRTDYGK